MRATVWLTVGPLCDNRSAIRARSGTMPSSSSSKIVRRYISVVSIKPCAVKVSSSSLLNATAERAPSGTHDGKSDPYLFIYPNVRLRRGLPARQRTFLGGRLVRVMPRFEGADRYVPAGAGIDGLRRA